MHFNFDFKLHLSKIYFFFIAKVELKLEYHDLTFRVCLGKDKQFLNIFDIFLLPVYSVSTRSQGEYIKLTDWNSSWKDNFVLEILPSKFYLTILWPFVSFIFRWPEQTFEKPFKSSLKHSCNRFCHCFPICKIRPVLFEARLGYGLRRYLWDENKWFALFCLSWNIQ